MAIKTAVFVEGLAELIIVRDFLYKWHDYNQDIIGFRCVSLRNKTNYHTVPYEVGGDNSELFFSIINVGNDNSVLSVMLSNAGNYLNLGYSRIIGLRDMYSDRYHSITGRRIDASVSQQFIDSDRKTIASKGYDGVMEAHYAIMEVEAWILGMNWIFSRIHGSLTVEAISSGGLMDCGADPETTIYHPARTLGEILRTVGMTYGKHADETERISGNINKEDYARLMGSGHCASFGNFATDLLRHDIRS